MSKNILLLFPIHCFYTLDKLGSYHKKYICTIRDVMLYQELRKHYAIYDFYKKISYLRQCPFVFLEMPLDYPNVLDPGDDQVKSLLKRLYIEQQYMRVLKRF